MEATAQRASETPKETLNGEEWATVAQSRASLYGFLGAVYNRRPDDQFAQGILGSALADFVAGVANEEELSAEMREGVDLIDRFIGASEGTPTEELMTQLGVERTRLVRGVKPGYGPPPPYESVYSSQMHETETHRLAAVLNAYAAADAIMPKDVHDQPDYIGLELDFMRHLCMKEGEAWAAGDEDAACEFIGRERSFLDEHIAPWVPRFCDVMADEAKLDFYRGIALITKAFVDQEIEGANDYQELAEETRNREES